MKKVWIPIKVDRNTARPNDWKNVEKPSKQRATWLYYSGKRKRLRFSWQLKRFGWNWSIWDILKEKWLFEMLKFHGVLTSCRVKRAPHSAAFPNLVSKAYEGVSECSQRPHMDEQGAKSYALQKRYRMWWKMLNNLYVTSISKATFYCCKRTNVNSKKKFRAKKNSGAPSQVIEDVPRSPAF